MPLLIVASLVLYLVDRELYLSLSFEDFVVEWATAIVLVLAAVVSWRIARQTKGTGSRRYLFFAVLGVLLFMAAFEEISWGQRIFGIATPDFWSLHNDQHELNLHNTFQTLTGLRTRIVVGIGLLCYGGILPLAMRLPGVARLVARLSVPVPPLWLAPSFILAFPLMLDLPSGQSEEYGELFNGLCLLILVWSWHSRKRAQPLEPARVREQA